MNTRTWTVVQDTGAEDDYYVITEKEDVLATGLTEADADLIAAAPDMLAALKAVMEAAEKWSPAIDQGCAAIAKAEGTS